MYIDDNTLHEVPFQGMSIQKKNAFMTLVLKAKMPRWYSVKESILYPGWKMLKILKKRTQ